jgi:hypothetical protein
MSVKAVSVEELYRVFGYQRWIHGARIPPPTNLTVELGVAIFAEMDRVEPFQHSKTLYDDEYRRCRFMLEVFRAACDCYPVLMRRAERAYFESLPDS